MKDNLAKDAGLELEIKEFSDYVLQNPATEDGSVDANYFQNQPYLDDYNKKNGTDIVPVVTVHLEPLGLYSNKVKSADALKSGATVAVPNDTVNEARALKLLDANGLITLKDGVGTEATPADITENPKKLKFKELEAAQTPRSLDDVDAAVINGNYALEADLSPANDALAVEPAKDNPNGNFLAVKKGNEDDPRVEEARQAPHLRRGQEVHRGQVEQRLRHPVLLNRYSGRSSRRSSGSAARIRRIATHGVRSLTGGGPRGAIRVLSCCMLGSSAGSQSFRRLRSGA